MLANRAVQTSMRRLAARQPGLMALGSQGKFAPPAIVALSQRRPVATERLSDSQAQNSILVNQRLKRPVAPHLSIYQPQITWYLSSAHRITGAILSGGFYIFGAAYLVAPLVGWHLESASLAAAVAAWPFAVKFAAKVFVSLPFTFHAYNGVRHLIWDTGSMMTNQKVIQSGWTVLGLTVASSLYLALM
ncbi:succinate dehydrogenase C subunit [Lineolata rhizophorae]|uniref:Succinate dehydrogenase C subunit n=1 Tax=Lineolata rhizophorae TaxID=578093 RepID=A0A6A6NVR5_9PEZI|nr:succinate dehydrogenase C subunit [Lineolata rhizophorae]